MHQVGSSGILHNIFGKTLEWQRVSVTPLAIRIPSHIIHLIPTWKTFLAEQFMSCVSCGTGLGPIRKSAVRIGQKRRQLEDHETCALTANVILHLAAPADHGSIADSITESGKLSRMFTDWITESGLLSRMRHPVQCDRCKR